MIAPVTISTNSANGFVNVANLRASNFKTPERLQAEQVEPNRVVERTPTIDTNLLTPFGLLNFKQLMERPPKQWLINQVFGAGDLVLLYGESGSGKTFVVIDLLLSCCTGMQWANRFDVARPLNVAYCAGEGVGGLAQRFKAAAQAQDIDDLPNLTIAQTVPSIFYDDGEESHIASIEKFILGWQTAQKTGEVQPLDVLVIDTLHSATTGADENSARDAGRILQLAKLATTGLGCTVVLVHHSNKSGTGERGSTAFRGAMDTVLSISKVGDGSQSVMQCAKLKDGEQWQQNTFSLVAVGETGSVRVWWDDITESNQSAKNVESDHRQTMLAFMKRQPNVAMTAKTLAEAAGIAQNHAIRLLGQMVKYGDCSSKLSDESKPNSSRNPMVYFIHSQVVHSHSQ